MRKKFEIDIPALLLEAEKNKCVESFEEDLFSLYKLYKSNYEVREVLTDPKYSLEFKMDCLKDIYKDANSSDFFYNFVALLMDYNLFSRLYSIYHKFQKLVAEKYNLTILQIITAVPLSREKNEKIKIKLELLLNNKIILKNIVDARIYGGLILKIPPDKIVDVSIRKKLLDLNQHIHNF
ncbi:MAG: ATP synthase F1 subunit delta [Candidatus Margulisiibacteriota bacterium]|nr:MAG: ATP synthase F1 subunit delta [Candidatus Margulisbacteria bacterium GWD2_39_127]OGI02668.1 MAG: ATP synthase F1 subunit delta [Candidatus Margulisbacteria bacterium GWF2_38_17]OGI05947.1 MAG: ATP synthase F1 subunit delta [Candidatus Margulisbacteria bacterium GWE2_39_32]PZM79999.1 MAG: ATP synthase F1 subunit delta [Candidatus Margulisiibacteriota bacterium]HAR62596.1 ATP synthase F1 subunit delta [Candidatus Margulisiibacteriota bacterium]